MNFGNFLKKSYEYSMSNEKVNNFKRSNKWEVKKIEKSLISEMLFEDKLIILCKYLFYVGKL